MTSPESSDEEDMFVLGGMKNHISMYQLASNAPETIDNLPNGDSDSSLDLNPSPRPRRGRPRKRARPASSSRGSDKRKRAQPGPEVIDLDNDLDSDDVICVSADAAPPPRGLEVRDAVDLGAARALEEARRMTAIGDDDAIAAEADRAARARQQRLENQRAAAAPPPRPASPASESGAVGVDAVAVDAEGTAGKSAAQAILLKVRAKGNQAKTMRIKTTDKLNKMLKPFCDQYGIDPSTARLQVDGEDVDKQDTPQTYDLEDNMVVDVVVR